MPAQERAEPNDLHLFRVLVSVSSSSHLRSIESPDHRRYAVPWLLFPMVRLCHLAQPPLVIRSR